MIELADVLDCLIMRRRWRDPAAIAVQIDRIRSLWLDALRRQGLLVFERAPLPACDASIRSWNGRKKRVTFF
jgi:hypothetical protein